MTREEIINGLQFTIDMCSYNPTTGDMTEPVNKYDKVTFDSCRGAIEVLKAEPCEDAVSRKHLLSVIDELMQSSWFNNGKDFYDSTNTHYGYVVRKEAVEIVRNLCVKTEPPVTPKQKTGKWIYPFIDGSWQTKWFCDNCYNIGCASDNFCSRCGAKMEGECK